MRWGLDRCDAAVVQVVEDSRGNVLDIGRRRRTIPTLLRRALRLREIAAAGVPLALGPPPVDALRAEHRARGQSDRRSVTH